MMNIIRYAMDIYYNRRNEWDKIIDNAMSVDYSWNTSADRYIDMYQKLTGIYDIPQKTESGFDENIKKDAEISAKAAADGAKEPEIKKVKNPFEDEKPVKKTAQRKTAAKKAAPQKTAAKGAKRTSAAKGK